MLSYLKGFKHLGQIVISTYKWELNMNIIYNGMEFLYSLEINLRMFL